jgi:hypothetical protein
MAGVLWAIVGSAQVLSAQGVGSLAGTVRDTTGTPLAGAEITVDDRRTTSNSQGIFRFDSLRVGNHLLAIRLVGYAPLRSPVTVRKETTYLSYVLRRATFVLPTVYTEARRPGIFGTIGDTAYRPLQGVKVQLAGRGGGEAITDSSGRFAFPSSIEGQYLVRATHPGYAEERLFVELKKGEGKELGIRLRPSRELIARADEQAVEDLGHRLAANLSGDRMSASQLNRYGSQGLCEVNQVARRVAEGVLGDNVTIILNGTMVMENMSVRNLCSWRADDVELVEFGRDVCRDVTRTLVDLLGVWCSNFRGNPRPNNSDPRSMRDPRGLITGGGGGGRIKTQKPSGPFIVIWEKR